LGLTSRASDRRNTGVALKALGDWAWQAGDLRAAQIYYERSRAIRLEAQDRPGVVITAKALADVEIAQGHDVPPSTLDKYAEEFARLEDDRGLGSVYHSRAVLAWSDGDVAQARELAQESLRLLEAVDDVQFQAVAHYTLACLAAGDSGEATALFQRGLELARNCRAVYVGAFLEEGYGDLLFRAGTGDQKTEGVALLGHAAELFGGMGRRDDARRAKRRLHAGWDASVIDHARHVLVFDLDEGPNGQGFAIPNDRRRAEVASQTR
jgi:tetratricopeptide (TPR) repeat protein